jgi:hypothetical protein
MSLIDINGINNYISAFEEFIFQNFSLISLLTGLLLLINNTLFIKKDLDKKKNVVKNKKYYALNVTGIVLLCVFLITHCISPYLPASYKNKAKIRAPVKSRPVSPFTRTESPLKPRPVSPTPSVTKPTPSPSPTPPASKEFDFFGLFKPKPKPKPILQSPPLSPESQTRPNTNDVGNIGTIPPRKLIEDLTLTASEGERLRIAARGDPELRRQLQLERLTPEEPRQLVQPVQPISKPLQITNSDFTQVNPLVKPSLLQKTLPVPPLVKPKVPSGPPRVELPAVNAPKGPRYGPDGKRIFENPYYGTGIGRGPGAPDVINPKK